MSKNEITAVRGKGYKVWNLFSNGYVRTYHNFTKFQAIEHMLSMGFRPERVLVFTMTERGIKVAK